MFFVPIAAALLFLWFIFYCIDLARTSNNEIKYRQYQDAASRLISIACDDAMERELSYSLELNRDKWNEIVRDFMGGGDEWSVYADYPSGKIKAVLVVMAQRGKLPHDIISYGVQLHRHNNGISSDRGICMNEEFILRIEKFLNSEKGLPVTAFVTTQVFDDEHRSHIEKCTLRDFIIKHGEGRTNYFTRYQFILYN